MAVKLIDLTQQPERCMFVSSPPEELTFAEAFWHSVRLQPTMESRLVSSDIKQRLGAKKKTSKSSNKLKEFFIRARAMEQIAEFERLRGLAEARMRDRNLLMKKREERIRKEEISRDRFPLPPTQEEIEAAMAETNRKIGEAYSIEQMIKEIDEFEQRKGIYYEEKDDSFVKEDTNTGQGQQIPGSLPTIFMSLESGERSGEEKTTEKSQKDIQSTCAMSDVSTTQTSTSSNSIALTSSSRNTTVAAATASETNVTVAVTTTTTSVLSANVAVKAEPTTSENGGHPAQDGVSPVNLVYHCWICGAEFVDKLRIINHLKESHKNMPELRGLERKMRTPICLVCGSAEECDHRKEGRRKRSQQKKICNEEEGEEGEEGVDDDDVDDLYDGVDDVAGTVSHPRVFNCVTCDAPFSNPDTLHQHRFKEHPDEKSYQCTYCPGTFAEHSHLVFHNRVHTGNRPYICLICENRFPKSSDLKRHSLIHSGEKPYKCAQCNQSFTQKGSLEKHARIHAKWSGGHPCVLCGLVFKKLDELMEHASVAHKNAHWQCKTCGKLYKEERHLILHEKGHHGARPYACNYCDRTFATRPLLLKHEDRAHRNKPEIKCDECGKHFKRRENLTRHKQSHRGIKNFKCEVCGQSFTEKGSLTRHTKSQHDLVRPHPCRLCGKAFTRKILLRKHMSRYHNQKLEDDSDLKGKKKDLYFRCKLCKKLLRKTGLRQHSLFHTQKGESWEGSLEDEDAEIKPTDLNSSEEDICSDRGDNIEDEEHMEEEEGAENLPSFTDESVVKAEICSDVEESKKDSY